jgi:hypothetical protein
LQRRNNRMGTWKCYQCSLCLCNLSRKLTVRSGGKLRTRIEAHSFLKLAIIILHANGWRFPHIFWLMKRLRSERKMEES